MELSELEVIGWSAGVLLMIVVAFAIVMSSRSNVEQAQTPSEHQPSQHKRARFLSERLILAGTILVSALGALSVDRYLLPPRPVEYRIIALDDATSAATLKSLGSDGWRVVSARRAINDDHGVYELIIMRE